MEQRFEQEEYRTGRWEAHASECKVWRVMVSAKLFRPATDSAQDVIERLIKAASSMALNA